MASAVIPARGGSKRIPMKNIRLFHGKPVLQYAIEAARDAGCFERIIVSTDNAAIRECALSLGAEVPFTRPDHLSDDHATTLEVLQHAARWLVSTDSDTSALCCIYPATPFLLPGDLLRGFDELKKGDVDYVFPVTTFESPIQRALRIDERGRVSMREPENASMRSQDLERFFHDAGQFYWGTSDAFLAGRPVLSGLAKAIVLPSYRVRDIDTEEDWLAASHLYGVLGRVKGA